MFTGLYMYLAKSCALQTQERKTLLNPLLPSTIVCIPFFKRVLFTHVEDRCSEQRVKQIVNCENLFLFSVLPVRTINWRLISWFLHQSEAAWRKGTVQLLRYNIQLRSFPSLGMTSREQNRWKMRHVIDLPKLFRERVFAFLPPETLFWRFKR